MTRYLLDTWAWIEYYEGSKIGREVRDKLIQNQCYTSKVSIAELSDNFHRKDLVTNYSWKDILRYVSSNSEITGLTPSIASRAGKIRTKEMEEYSGFGLIDAIILATAREKNLKVLTGDKHLKNKESAIDLEKI